MSLVFRIPPPNGQHSAVSVKGTGEQNAEGLIFLIYIYFFYTNFYIGTQRIDRYVLGFVPALRFLRSQKEISADPATVLRMRLMNRKCAVRTRMRAQKITYAR